MAEQKTMDEIFEECEMGLYDPHMQILRGRCSIADGIEFLHSDEGEACLRNHYDTRLYVSWHEDGRDPYEVFYDVESAVGFLFVKDFENKYEVGEISIQDGDTDYSWSRLNISLIGKANG